MKFNIISLIQITKIAHLQKSRDDQFMLKMAENFYTLANIINNKMSLVLSFSSNSK